MSNSASKNAARTTTTSTVGFSYTPVSLNHRSRLHRSFFPPPRLHNCLFSFHRSFHCHYFFLFLKMGIPLSYYRKPRNLGNLENPRCLDTPNKDPIFLFKKRNKKPHAANTFNRQSLLPVPLEPRVLCCEQALGKRPEGRRLKRDDTRCGPRTT